MPMIDTYAATGTFPDTHKLAVDAAAIVREVEEVPDILMFRQNTTAFVHEMPPGTFAVLIRPSLGGLPGIWSATLSCGAHDRRGDLFFGEKALGCFAWQPPVVATGCGAAVSCVRGTTRCGRHPRKTSQDADLFSLTALSDHP
jgi:hypothetical protein